MIAEIDVVVSSAAAAFEVVAVWSYSIFVVPFEVAAYRRTKIGRHSDGVGGSWKSREDERMRRGGSQ